MTIDYYIILGIPRSATQKDIKQAYRKAVQKWHPDRHEDSDESKRRTQMINEAYSALSDPDKRRRYDRGEDVSQQTAVVRTHLEDSLLLHTVKHGGIKNGLMLVAGITLSITAGWWGVVLGAAMIWSIFQSVKSLTNLKIPGSPKSP